MQGDDRKGKMAPKPCIFWARGPLEDNYYQSYIDSTIPPSQMMSSVMPPEGSDVVMTKLLMSSNGNGASNGGGGGSQAAGGPAAVASGVGGASLMATGNTHHLFDSAPPIQVRLTVLLN